MPFAVPLNGSVRRPTGNTMKAMTLKNALKGILIALLAAFIYAAIILTSFLGAGWVLLNTCWFVIPAGAVIGIMIPRITERKTPLKAALSGIILAIFLGSIGSLLIAFYFDVIPVMSPSARITNPSLWWAALWRRVVFQAIFMAIYSAIWIAGYAYYRAKRIR